MIQLNTRNGHDQEVIKAFNDASSYFEDSELLFFIFTRWADNHDIAEITSILHGKSFLDIDGQVIHVGDIVVILDDTELDENPPKRGDVLQVTALLDLESNFIECGKHSLFAHRVLKVKINT